MFEISNNPPLISTPVMVCTRNSTTNDSSNYSARQKVCVRTSGTNVHQMLRRLYRLSYDSYRVIIYPTVAVFSKLFTHMTPGVLTDEAYAEVGFRFHSHSQLMCPPTGGVIGALVCDIVSSHEVRFLP